MAATVQTLVNAIYTKSYGEAKEQFGSLIQSRVASIVDRMKKVEATQLFVPKKA